MISYGGIPLIDPPAQLAAWVNLRIPLQDVFGFQRWPWLGDADLDPRAQLHWFLSRGVRVGTYCNPWGASRWGIGYFLADQDSLAAIRQQAYSGTARYQALPLILDDADGQRVTTNLWMLPPVPLSVFNHSLKVFLLVLVDDRFWWWERSASIAITEKTTTWAQVYTQIGTGLGATINADTISSAYVYPGIGLAKQYKYLPLVLDWAASSIGQRIVRRLDGSIYALNAGTAKTLAIVQASQYVKLAGGSLSLGVVDA